MTGVQTCALPIYEIFDFFVALDANDEQLEFPVIYAAAKNGYAKYDLSDESAG